jgi:hypothetical protein
MLYISYNYIFWHKNIQYWNLFLYIVQLQLQCTELIVYNITLLAAWHEQHSTSVTPVVTLLQGSPALVHHSHPATDPTLNHNNPFHILLLWSFMNCFNTNFLSNISTSVVASHQGLQLKFHMHFALHKNQRTEIIHYLWHFWCVVSRVLVTNPLQHNSHRNGLCPVWYRICTTRVERCVNAFPHWSQEWGFSPVCERLWIRK